MRCNFFAIFTLFSVNLFATDHLNGFLVKTNRDQTALQRGINSVPQEGGSCVSCPNLSVASNGDEYTPESAADLSNPANTGRTAIISNSFNVSGATFAANQILVPAGGSLSGTKIDLNGAEIVIKHQGIFDENARFTSSYKGCMTPENFGAASLPDDASAFHALGDNAWYGLGQKGVTYVVNTPVVFRDNQGDFDRIFWGWLGNGCTISSTFASVTGVNRSGVLARDIRQNPASYFRKGEDYLFNFIGVDVVSWCDTTLEGNDILHFGILTDANFYAYNSKWLNFANDERLERVLMVSYWVDATQVTQLVFDHCEFRKATPRDPGSAIGDAAGLTRGILFNLTNVSVPRTYYVKNSAFHSFYGEGEGIHWFPTIVRNSDWNHNVILRVLDSDFSDNSRRDIKSQHSGVQAERCIFTKIDYASPWAGKTTSNFSASLADAENTNWWCTNTHVKDCTFQPGPSGFQYTFLALTGVKDARITGNSFKGPYIGYVAISLDNHTAGTTISGNTFVDIGAVTGVFQDVGAFDVNEVFENTVTATVDRKSRNYSVFGQPLRIGGAVRRLYAYDNDITITFNVDSSRPKVLGSDPGNTVFDAMIYTAIHLDNNRITYKGPYAAGKKVIDIGGDFDATNAFTNHNPVIGVTASGAFKVKGVQTFTATNNANDAGEKITKK